MSELALMYSRLVAYTRCTDCLKFNMYCEGLLPHRMKKAANVSYKCDRCNRLLTSNTVTREVDDEELPGEKASMASKEKPPCKVRSKYGEAATVKEKRRAKKLQAVYR